MAEKDARDIVKAASPRNASKLPPDDLQVGIMALWMTQCGYIAWLRDNGLGSEVSGVKMSRSGLMASLQRFLLEFRGTSAMLAKNACA